MHALLFNPSGGGSGGNNVLNVDCKSTGMLNITGVCYVNRTLPIFGLVANHLKVKCTNFPQLNEVQSCLRIEVNSTYPMGLPSGDFLSVSGRKGYLHASGIGCISYHFKRNSFKLLNLTELPKLAAKKSDITGKLKDQEFRYKTARNSRNSDIKQHGSTYYQWENSIERLAIKENDDLDG